MISGRWCKVVRIFAKLSNAIDSDKVSSANFRHLVSRLSLLLSLNQVVDLFTWSALLHWALYHHLVVYSGSEPSSE